MMIEDPHLSHHKVQLAKELLEWKAPAVEPLPISPWLAMSLMQKSIRRGRGDLAQMAAARLLEISSERLWRRLGVTAFEDIGVGDIASVSQVVAALGGKRFRAQIGGEWPVASYLVTRMAQATKCRATDDLAIAAEMHPAFGDARRDMASATQDELAATIASDKPLPEKAIALWYLIGTEKCPSEILQRRSGMHRDVFGRLRELGLPDETISVAEEGFRKSGALMCPLTVILQQEMPSEAPDRTTDEFPEEVGISGIPCWAYDMHVREAKRAFSAFLETGAESAKWIRANVPRRIQSRFLGGILFRVESGLVDRLIDWPPAMALRRMVDIYCSDVAGLNVSEVLELLRQDIPKLNEVRCDVLAN